MRRYRVVGPGRRLILPTAVAAALAWSTAAPGAEEPEGSRELLERRCRAEVVELHAFIERWSNAEEPRTEQAFRRFADVIAPSFVIIDPHGAVIEREPIVEAVRDSWGRWRDNPGKIRIENFRLHQHGGGLALASYEEWHDLGKASVGRLSSVLFGADSEAPNGLAWLHLHEVWLPPAGTDP